MKADKDVSGEVHVVLCENVLNRAYDVFQFEDTFKKVVIINRKPVNEKDFLKICDIQRQSELN